ncbi:hypothetical protein PFISCL1PPCAC_142, partial [Pristionchus fissidentatus]
PYNPVPRPFSTTLFSPIPRYSHYSIMSTPRYRTPSTSSSNDCRRGKKSIRPRFHSSSSLDESPSPFGSPSFGSSPSARTLPPPPAEWVFEMPSSSRSTPYSSQSSLNSLSSDGSPAIFAKLRLY